MWMKLRKGLPQRAPEFGLGWEGEVDPWEEDLGGGCRFGGCGGLRGCGCGDGGSSQLMTAGDAPLNCAGGQFGFER